MALVAVVGKLFGKDWDKCLDFFFFPSQCKLTCIVYITYSSSLQINFLDSNFVGTELHCQGCCWRGGVGGLVVRPPRAADWKEQQIG